ncbi:hypothetical protein [Haliovirga abyssi]|uniref:Uncharacterized protein n=1 Tax=Haliovirga abyssi TaxID=2996794 RepID=A0AAU9DWB1_9FUSO|nr:hypothetical protein [Haliovirga abyssi]BDU51684.1 hypothetical protein HLVA_22530 [Haliovirga abyssi]
MVGTKTKFNNAVEKKKMKVINMIDELEIRINKEILKIKREDNSSELIPSQNELERILAELEKMKTKMSPKLFLPSYTRNIVDSWDIYSELGSALLKLARKYNELI